MKNKKVLISFQLEKDLLEKFDKLFPYSTRSNALRQIIHETVKNKKV
jgi:metal-responsive CopG/Arc/MetJ family transcriptional regulator